MFIIEEKSGFKILNIKGIEIHQLEIKEDDFINIIMQFLLNKKNIIYYGTMMNVSKDMESIHKWMEKIGEEEVKETIKKAFITLGWISKSNNFEKIKGDLNEYLMGIVIDEIFKKKAIKTIIPKIIFKTNPRMPAFGDDNVFYSSLENRIYMGEAKMFQSFSVALTDAIESLENKDMIERIAWLETRTDSIKDKELSEKLEYKEIKIKDLKKGYIIFITSETLNPHYETHENKIEKLKNENIDVIYSIHLPVFSLDSIITTLINRIEREYE